MEEAFRAAGAAPSQLSSAPAAPFSDPASHEDASGSDDLTGSQILDRLHLSLSESAETRSAHSINELADLAEYCGVAGMAYRRNPNIAHKQQEWAIVNSVAKELADRIAQNAGRAPRAILGFACLAQNSHNGELKEKLSLALAPSLANGDLELGFRERVATSRAQRSLLARSIQQDRLKALVEEARKRLSDQQQLEQAKLQALDNVRRQRVENLTKSRFELWLDLLHQPVSPEIWSPELNFEDLNLLLKWVDPPVKSLGPNILLEQVAQLLPANDFQRLWTARSAERVAIEYFRKRQETVLDVSISQLEPGTNEWKTHDLEVGQRSIDVKCARQSYSSPRSFSEYMVPSYKKDRRNGANVEILAVFSEYLTKDTILGDGRTLCTVLGSVTASQVEALGRWLEKIKGGILQVGVLAGAKLPGWMFEYDANHHPKRTAAIARVEQYLGDFFGGDGDDSEVPDLPLLVFIEEEPRVMHHLQRIFKPSAALDERLQIWHSLREAIKFDGGTRRSLFVTILAHTLAKLREHDTLFRPAWFAEFLFPDKLRRYVASSGAGQGFRLMDDKRFPLGLFDPLKYIDSIIELMQQMWITARQELQGMESFHLTSPEILKGRDREGREWTLMAYCGGWREIEGRKIRVKCGRSPLVKGPCTSCPQCLRLICPSCGTCHSKCSRMLSQDQ